MASRFGLSSASQYRQSLMISKYVADSVEDVNVMIRFRAGKSSAITYMKMIAGLTLAKRKLIVCRGNVCLQFRQLMQDMTIEL